mgnify:CR=1 FL=1
MEHNKVQELEEEIIKKLGDTQLFADIKFHRGEFKSKENPPCLEYKLKSGPNGIRKGVETKAKELSFKIR